MTARQPTPEERAEVAIGALRSMLAESQVEKFHRGDIATEIRQAVQAERDRLIALAGSEEALPVCDPGAWKDAHREAQRAIVARMKETP